MLLSAAAAISAYAQPPTLSGNDLARWCGNSRETFCSGYVLGFAAALPVADSLKDVCVPNEATAAQMRAVVMAYIRANPKDLHNPAEVIVGLAYLDAWPCKRAR